MLLFPNFRYVVSYLKAVAVGTPSVKTGLHTVFILPIIILALFSNPIKEHVLSNARFSWLSESQFDFCRILLVILWALLRISTAKIQLQAYLDLSLEKLQILRRETGYIKSNELQRMIYQYASYFCAAALQYFLPVLLTLVIALLLKSVGNIGIFETPEASSVLKTNVTEPTVHAFLSLEAQKPMWTFFLVMILTINVSLYVHARCISNLPAEENNTVFLVGTYTLKEEGQIYLLEADDNWTHISGKPFLFHDGEVLHLSGHPKMANIFSTCSLLWAGGKLKPIAGIWQLNDEKSSISCLSSFDVSEKTAKILEFHWHNSGDQAVVLYDHSISICDVSDSHNMKNAATKKLDVRRLNNITWNPHGSGTNLCLAADSNILELDSRTLSSSFTITNAHAHNVLYLDYNPLVPYRLASAGEDGRVCLWDTRKTTAPFYVFHDHSHWVWNVKHNPIHDQLMLSCSSDGRVFLSHLITNKDPDIENPIKSVEKELVVECDDSVYSFAWAANDPFIFAALSYDGRVTIAKIKRDLKYKILNL
uniref:EIPR1-like beta-propeller domain-containing protein n=1 Tax=Acrobeloides nanus TaxID=290746 RepID=A0A914CAW4_9BILA